MSSKALSTRAVDAEISSEIVQLRSIPRMWPSKMDVKLENKVVAAI